MRSVFKIEALIWVSFARALKFQPSNFKHSVEGLVQIQDVNPRIQKWNTKLILNLCMKYMVHVSNTMWRIKNQPSNSTSCSENGLRLLVLVAGQLYWGLQVLSSFSSWDCVLKSYFERGVFWRAKSRLKALKTFNLGHCVRQATSLGIRGYAN